MFVFRFQVYVNLPVDAKSHALNGRSTLNLGHQQLDLPGDGSWLGVGAPWFGRSDSGELRSNQECCNQMGYFSIPVRCF